jgi:hypothetical protein
MMHYTQSLSVYALSRKLQQPVQHAEAAVKTCSRWAIATYEPGDGRGAAVD